MSEKKVIVTGGAGFIGCNAARHYLAKGWEVEIWDNLSRRGGASNLEWLRSHGSIDFHQIDIRDAGAVEGRMSAVSPDLILHCAGQVAVTTSVADPRADMEVNLIGTFNLLEAVRAHAPEAFFLYACTNKVYGGMEDLGVVLRNGRYEYENLPGGVGEDRPLDFHSPYGCSKGAAYQEREKTVGQVYNIGDGPENQLSLHELMGILKDVRGYPLEYSYADWRPGDQRVFVADISKAQRDFGWRPQHDSRSGIARLAAWVDENLHQFKDL